MTGTAILSYIIEILTGGITGIASGVGTGISTLVTSIFLTGEGSSQTVSVFGTLVVVFAGIALAIGLCRVCVRFIQSLGGHRM